MNKRTDEPRDFWHVCSAVGFNLDGVSDAMDEER